ncbi:MAG: hypothetical protein ACRDGM_05845 [bacterium]
MTNQIVASGPTATDYVLVTDAYAQKDGESTRQVVEFSPPSHIDGDLWIAQIDHAFCERILDACDPAGENFKPVRHFGCSYAFYRINAPAGNGHLYHFDSDSALYECIALSRIVHPTSVGFASAARILNWPDGAQQIIPAFPSSLNPWAFVIAPNENWLIPDDLPAVRALLNALHAQPLPKRIETALWHHEAAARHSFIDLRWPLLTTCLEALVRIKDEKLPSGQFAGSTKVFVDRLLAIGGFDATLAVPEAELRGMYAQRSLLAHGLGFGSLDDASKVLYRVQECLVRGTIRKALLDSAFRNFFVSDANVAGHLPLR